MRTVCAYQRIRYLQDGVDVDEEKSNLRNIQRLRRAIFSVATTPIPVFPHERGKEKIYILNTP
jgi:hypothetical protein